jgi:hypothetical protein
LSSRRPNCELTKKATGIALRQIVRFGRDSRH